MMSARRRWRLGLLLGSLALAVGGLSALMALTGYAFYPGPSFPPASAGGNDGLEQAPTPEPTASVLTPVATMIAPDASIAEPHQTIVTPETNVAQAESRPASADSNSDLPFTTIGIASGVAVAAIVLVAGAVFRAVRRRPPAD